MEMIKFEKTLEDVAGALVDLAHAGVVVEIFMKKVTQILYFDAHGKGEGNEASGGGLGVGGGSGMKFSEKRIGGAGGVFHEEICEATCDVAAGAFGIKASVMPANGGFRFFPKFDREEGGGVDEAAFQSVFEVVAGVSDFVGEIDHLGFEKRVEAGAGEGIDAEANFVSEVESVEFGVFDLELFDDAQALTAATEATGILHELVESLFDGVTKGGVPEVTREGDGFGQILI